MMFLRLLGVQGIAGIAVSLALAILLVVQKGETRHWRKQSGQYEQLYGQERAALVGTAPPPSGPAPPIWLPLNAPLPNSARLTKGPSMTIRLALLTLVLALSACAFKPPQPQPIPAVAERRQCPAYPLPPAELLKAPAKTDFLPRTR